MQNDEGPTSPANDFPYAGITVFILFFGTSLLNALTGGRWLHVLYWTAAGLLFLVLDRMRRTRRQPT
jgi:hypothetical protein